MTVSAEPGVAAALRRATSSPSSTLTAAGGVGGASGRAPGHAWGRVPDFFIVGHFKCGTTALYEMLRQHPQIYMPDTKELWFFSPELRSRGRSPSAARPETLAGYLELFAPARADQRTGEASPSYLMSATAAERIAAERPDARIVAILREPASFLRSFHLQCVRNHVETETDLGRALALEPARRRGERIPRFCSRPHELLYSDHVRYVRQLLSYEQAFGRARMLVLIYEDFRRDNEAALREVLRFLDVDEQAPIRPVEANPSVRVRSQRLHELTQTASLGRGPLARAAKVAVKSVTWRSLRRRALRATRKRIVYGDVAAPDPNLMAELRRRFAPEVAALSEYLGRDLVSLWGYDRLR